MRLIVPPPPVLQPFIHDILIDHLGGGELHLPAKPQPQLIAYLQGGSAYLGGDGLRHPLPRVVVTGPCRLPHLTFPQPGTQYLMLTFRHGCFERFFDMPVDWLIDQYVGLDSVIGREVAMPLLDRLEQATQPMQWVQELTGWLFDAMCRRQGPMAWFPGLTLNDLIGRADALADRLNLSTRQLERRFKLAYGMPFRDFRRIARFGLGFAHLVTVPNDSLPARGMWARLAQDLGYFDQAHFDRDFRTFVGVSPSQFLRQRMTVNPGTQEVYRFSQQEVSALFL
ncbi:helix-turn-helix domain-containing protein [Chitinivorax sp. B]|uniref:AraC family transcriptional regulator n=1 Tax=Chitinivorax sp. B TaxID=2502235 RepID=UPI0010F73CB1|nr:helix-turn-helix domain-containing protein [Chitinivorax sp. B]